MDQPRGSRFWSTLAICAAAAPLWSGCSPDLHVADGGTGGSGGESVISTGSTGPGSSGSTGMGGGGTGISNEIFAITQDTFLDALNPTWNYGASPELRLGNEQIVLLRFDVSSVSPNVQVLEASVTLPVSGVMVGDILDLRELALGNAGWIEGTGDGVTAASGEPCWSELAYPMVGWASGGSEISPSDYASTPLPLISWAGGVYVWDLTTTVQTWILDPGSNAGLVVLWQGSGATVLSREAMSTAALSVSYSGPTGP